MTGVCVRREEEIVEEMAATAETRGEKDVAEDEKGERLDSAGGSEGR